MNNDELYNKAVDMAADLGEHADAVQILLTWTDAEGTHAIKAGSGNWYARQGLATKFINSDIAEDNAFQIAKALQKDDE